MSQDYSFNGRTIKFIGLCLILSVLAAALFSLQDSTGVKRIDPRVTKQFQQKINRPIELPQWADRLCELHGTAASYDGYEANLLLSRIQQVIAYDLYHRILFERLRGLLASLETESISPEKKQLLLRLAHNALVTQTDDAFDRPYDKCRNHAAIAEIHKVLSANAEPLEKGVNSAADPDKRSRNIARKTYELLQRLRDGEQQYIALELLDLNISEQRTIKDLRNVMRKKEADYLLARDRELISCFTSHQIETTDPVPHIKQICNQQRMQPLYDDVTGAIDGWWRNPDWLARGIIQHIATPAELRMIRAKIIAEAYLSKINQLETAADFLESRDSIEFIKQQESIETILDRISARDMKDKDIAEAYNRAGPKMIAIYNSAHNGERDNVQTIFDYSFMASPTFYLSTGIQNPYAVAEFVTRTLSGHSILESAYDPIEAQIIEDWTTYIHAEIYRLVALSTEDTRKLIAMPMPDKQPKNGM